MIIQKQEWSERTCYLIANSKGSVLLELFPDARCFGGTAFISSLWVEPSARRQYVASSLMYIVEDLARQMGHSSVFLEWMLKDTPREILDWYMRKGYQKRSQDFFGDNYCYDDPEGEYFLLEKQL